MFRKPSFRPILQTLGNECFAALKQFFTEANTTYQLTPQGIHCHNAEYVPGQIILLQDSAPLMPSIRSTFATG